MTQNEKLTKDYIENGFAVLPRYLPADFIAELDEAIFRPFDILAKTILGAILPLATDEQHRMEVLKELKKRDECRYLNALKISQNDPAILAAPAHPGIKSALGIAGLKVPVLSLKPFPVVLASDLQVEGGYNFRPPHQEWPVMQGSHNAVVMWFPLHELSAEHSSLEIYPGSHRRGVLDFEVSRCGSKVVCTDLGEPVRPPITAGDIVLFSAFTVHRSAPTASRLRRAISLRFNDLEDPSFVARGFPDNSKTVIDRNPIDKLDHRFVHNGEEATRV